MAATEEEAATPAESFPPPLPGVTQCAPSVICVPPVADPVEACTMALTLARSQGAHAEPSECQPPTQVASASRGALRGAALITISQADTVFPQVVVLASERGFDRVVSYDWLDVQWTSGDENEYRKFAIEDVVPGGAAELRIETHHAYDYSTCDGSEGNVGKRDDVRVCGTDEAGVPYCLNRLPRSFESRQFTYDYETDKRVYTDPVQFTLDVRFVRGGLVVKRRAGELPEQVQRLLGRHTLAQAAQLISALQL